MTIQAERWGEVPALPSVYVMHGGDMPRTWPAYVGIAQDLQGRLLQHFVRRDSSVVTGTAAAGLNIEGVRFVDWWSRPALADKSYREAAELVAFDLLNPALRSRGRPTAAAAALAAQPAFQEEVQEMFSSPPDGRYWPPRLDGLAERVRVLEARLAELEARLRQA